MFAFNRVNQFGLKFQFMELPEGRTRITCNGKTIIVNHDPQKLSRSWYYWDMQGWKVQDSFPYLDNDEREFLMTAITPNEWNEIFAEETE